MCHVSKDCEFNPNVCVCVCLPGVARVIMCGVKLPQLLPGQVRDGQGLPPRHHSVGVVWIQFVLEVLGINSLVVRLQKAIQRNKITTPTWKKCSFRTAVTYESSLHLIKHHPFKDEGGVGVTGVLVFQPPAFLPEQITRPKSAQRQRHRTLQASSDPRPT